MTSTSPHEYFGFKCPAGGQFHICLGAKVEFIGCCESDPCADDSGICPPEDMRWSAFNPERYEDLPPQSCNNAEGASNWYTCKFGSPSFMGCCAGNPCAEDGCPRTQLIPATLSKDEEQRRMFLDPEPSQSNPSETSGTIPPTGSPTNTNGTQPPEGSEEAGLSTGAIAGISVGAAAVALLLFAFLFWRFWWRPRRARDGHGYAHPSPDSNRESAFLTDPPKYHSSQYSPSQFSPAQFSPAQFSPAQFSPAHHHPAQHHSTQYHPAPIAEVDGDRTGIQEIGTSQHFRHELSG